MTDLRTELATLIASRICHDLISPVGAISNGLELMELGGAMPGGPELTLISESCDNANARIRFFRVAYGAANATAMISTGEVRSILSDLTKGTRLEVLWSATGDVPRADVQLAFLALQCLETALRRGGRVTIAADAGRVSLTAEAAQVSCDPELWQHLDGPAASHAVLGRTSGVAPAHVQFVLLPLLAADRARKLDVTATAQSVSIQV